MHIRPLAAGLRATPRLPAESYFLSPLTHGGFGLSLPTAILRPAVFFDGPLPVADNRESASAQLGALVNRAGQDAARRQWQVLLNFIISDFSLQFRRQSDFVAAAK